MKLAPIKMIFKKFSYLLTGLLFVAPAIAADTTVSVYTWRMQEAELWKRISDENRIPGVKIDLHVIRYQVHETYEPHVLIDVLHGKADVFQWSPGASKLKPLIDNGVIKPNPYGLSSINKAALPAAIGPDGDLYGVPFALQLEALLVNDKLLKKHGVHGQPRTLGEMDQAFSKLKAAGVTPLYIAGAADWVISQVTAEVMLAGLVEEGFAQHLVDGEACFTDDAYVEIFRVLQSWKSKGFINPGWETDGYSSMGTAVAVGNAAMSFEGGWKTGSASDYYLADPDFQFGFWAVPGASSKVYGLGDGTYQVNHTSPRAEAAYKVLQYTATQEFAELFAEEVQELPAYGGEFAIDNPMLKKMADLLAANSYPVSLFVADNVNRGKPAYKTLVVEAFKGALAGRMSPEQAAAYVQKGLNSWGYVGAERCAQ